MERWRNGFPVRQARARPLATFSVLALVGMLVAREYRVPAAWGFAACGASLAAAAALRLLHRSPRAAVMLLGLCLGAARVSAALEALPAVATQYNAAIVGRVASDPFTNPDTGRVIARFLPETVNGSESRLRLRLYLRGDADALTAIEYGQRLSLRGHIWANDPVTNPWEFDFADYLHRNAMDAIATAKIEDVDILDTRRDLTSAVIGLRHAISRRIDALFPHSAAIVRALALGDRSMISEEARRSLKDTGTAHLIAVSGLHVTLVAMAMRLLLTRFMSARRAGLLTLIPLLFYGMLAGFSAPFVRAIAMFGLMSLGLAEGLPSDPVTRLCAAMLGYLMVRPLSVLDGGFALSFTASAGILLLMPPLTHLFHVDALIARRPSPKRLRRAAHRAAVYFPSLLCASLAAQLATLPVVTACFGAQSVISIPFNLVCVPLCVAGYALALAALLLGPLGVVAAPAADGLLWALTAITRYGAALPVTTVHIGRYPVPLALLHFGLMLAASDLSALRKSLRRFLPLSLVAVAGLAMLTTWSRSLPFSVTFLDAGQADCAVLRADGHTYLIDAGDTYTPASDYLSATALNLDGVFLSHPHQDHAGGLSDILDCFQPGAIYVPAGWFDQTEVSAAVTEGIERARSMGIPIVELSAGDVVSPSPGVEFKVYNPPREGDADEINDLSLLLLARCGNGSVLFTGDLPDTAEPEALPDCDVLKVAHHGADGSTSARFLAVVTPETAVIQVGENSHGHPTEETLARLEACGATVLRNDRLGAITLTCDGDCWHIDTYLEASNDLE